MELDDLMTNDLKTIQKNYKNIVHHIIESYYEEYKNSGLTFDKYYSQYCENKEYNLINCYLDHIEIFKVFWKNNSSIIKDVTNLDKEKIILTGDLFGSSGNPFQNYAFSSDLVVLHDPFLKNELLIKDQINYPSKIKIMAKKILSFFIKIIEFLTVNEKCNELVTIIIPYYDKNVKSEKFEEVSQIITLNKINEIYTTKYNDIYEASADIGKINNINTIHNNLNNISNLVWDIDEHSHYSITEQFDNFVMSHLERGDTLGDNFIQNIHNRTRQSLDSIMNSQDINASNVMEAKTSYRHLQWTLENINNKNKGIYEGQRKTDAISSLNIQFEWFQDLSLDTLVILQKEGFLLEIKALFNKYFYSLVNSKSESDKNLLNRDFNKLLEIKINELKPLVKKSDIYYLTKKTMEFSLLCGTIYTAPLIGIPAAFIWGLDVLDKNEQIKPMDNDSILLRKFINLHNY